MATKAEHKAEHKAGLIKMYQTFIAESQPQGFMFILFDNAIHKLKNEVEPKKVEQWVVDMEKLWKKFL